MPQTFQPFALERLLSRWEHAVTYNLSESGVHPLTLKELVAYQPRLMEEMLATELGYAVTNGSPALREAIAHWYPGATVDNVLVTVGCIEANFLVLTTLLQPGDQVAIQVPNYLQTWGIAHNMGAVPTTFSLNPDQEWALDVAALEAAVTDQTRLIAVCNPNNPTGKVFTSTEMEAVIRIAEARGAWLLADEVYAGAERETDRFTPTFYGRYDRVLATGSLSKAYGLPGLRVGWVVGPAEMIEQLWARHDYLTISTTRLADILATLALSPQVRPHLLQRGRHYIRRGWSILEAWVRENAPLVSLVPPQAGAIAFPRYHLAIDSVTLVDRLIREHSVLVAAGDYFGIPHHLRISYGLEPEVLQEGLRRISTLLHQIAQEEE
ncbi:MAG: aminotransferase class I/II-fold pyridoxal phosphate-dependent enzyme [Nitrospinota bacterium]|nr:MAG: aminotransferase class I/II-fold pyridoxal phosphate-dependent enzyme [Nitrospinota bacterium]